MGKLHRIDPPDTIDTAIRLLGNFQAEGWQLASMTTDIDYRQAGHNQRSLPVEAFIVVRLQPAR